MEGKKSEYHYGDSLIFGIKEEEAGAFDNFDYIWTSKVVPLASVDGSPDAEVSDAYIWHYMDIKNRRLTLTHVDSTGMDEDEDPMDSVTLTNIQAIVTITGTHRHTGKVVSYSKSTGVY